MLIIHPSKQKFVVTAIAAAVSFFGLMAASSALVSYQIDNFLLISLYVWVFLVFWQSFIFDLHLKPAPSLGALEKTFFSALRQRFGYMLEMRHFLHYQNYLILPAIIYWATVGLLFLNPFDPLLKFVFISAGVIALAITVWYLKTVFYSHSETARSTRQVLFLAKIYASYAAFAASLGLARYFGWDVMSFTAVAFAVNYALFHQALFQHHFVRFSSVQIMMVSGLVIAEVAAMVYLLWNVNYFSGALVIAAVYNTLWGYVQHKYIDRDLTREILYEYLAVLFVVLVILYNTTNFAERVY